MRINRGNVVMKRTSKKDNPWYAAGLMSVMGLDIAICMLLGYWIGKFANQRFGISEMWIVGGLFIGLAVGILSVIIIVKKVLEDTDG
jgi:ATP synthase protein I